MNQGSNLCVRIVRIVTSTNSKSKSNLKCSILGGSYQIFASSGFYRSPAETLVVRLLVVGGGGGGGGITNCGQGGGSGYVAVDSKYLVPNTEYSITVGKGGSCEVRGGNSSFGTLLATSGGMGSTGLNGGNGSSGGGTLGTCSITYGGSGGSDGKACNPDRIGGKGQGDYTYLLSQFKHNSITAGAGGGQSKLQTYYWGGGGGGILINGVGPSASDGSANGAPGLGGKGYGAGGGAGGFNTSNSCALGGAGASGLVYFEWD